MSSQSNSKVPDRRPHRAQAKAELKRLAAEIGAHDKRYYQEDAPTVSDAAYDALRRRYDAIEARFPDLRTEESLSLKVGAAPSGRFAKVRHAVPMLSLDNAFSEQDVVDFVDRIRRFLRLPEDETIAFTAEPKIDGLSMSLRYEDGALVKAATRGDGSVGEDVTANVRTLKDVPHQLKGRNIPAVAEMRGEIYMTKQAFLALNKRQAEAGDTVFANPRNSAAGSLRQKDPDDHRVAAAAFLRLQLGRAEHRSGRHAVRHARLDEARRLRRQPAHQGVPQRRGVARLPSRHRAKACHPRLRHRRRRLQGRSPRLATAARLRLTQSALGDRAQVCGREGDHRRQRDRHSGRPHGRAHADRAARACDRRRRGGVERDAAQRGRDRAPGRAGRAIP